MSVTDLRIENNTAWHAYADRNPDKVLTAALNRQRHYQELTAGGANDGKPWTEQDFQTLMQNRPILDISLELGRTYKACVQARKRRLKMLGLTTSYLKSESDPYDGSDRRFKLEEREDHD